MRYLQTDVVIVGAGFGGLACARFLAQAGLRTVVLERKADVGENIHTTGILVKEAFEAWTFPAHLTRPVPNIRLYAPNLRHIDLSSPGYHFLTTDTANLLRHMAREAKAAGADIRCNTPFTGNAMAEADRIILPDSGLSCRYLIGADGANSRVADAFGLGKNRRHLIGVELEYENIQGLDESSLHCFMDSRLAPGYIAWVAPGVHVTQIGLAGTHPFRPDMDAFLAKLSGLFDFSQARQVGRRGGLIPVGGRVEPFGTERVILLGDAAGIVSPLTAGGIYTALHYGKLCAESVGAFLLDDGPSPAETMKRHYPRFGWKKLMRAALDINPPNALLDHAIGNPVFRAFAQTVFYHHRGLLSPGAWREMLYIPRTP